MQTSSLRYVDLIEGFLQRVFPHESGVKIPIMAMAVDTGHNAPTVYKLARRNYQLSTNAKGSGVRVTHPRTVIPVRGSPVDHWKLLAGVTDQETARKRQGVKIVSVGTAFAKTDFYSSIQVLIDERKERPDEIPSGPGIVHFPMYANFVFQGFMSESLRTTATGKREFVIDYERNEPLDTYVYARAAAACIGADAWGANPDKWRAIEKAQGIKRTGQPKASTVDAPPTDDVDIDATPEADDGEDANLNESATPKAERLASPESTTPPPVTASRVSTVTGIRGALSEIDPDIIPQTSGQRTYDTELDGRKTKAVERGDVRYKVRAPKLNRYDY